MIGGLCALALVWLALTQRLDPASLILGVCAIVAVMLIQRTVLPRETERLSELLRRPDRVLLLLGTLAVRLVGSTLYTTRLILFGGEEGRMVALPTRIRHAGARFLLLNAITLTPSTISLLAEEDLLYIHWLKRRRGSGDWRKIKDSLERRILALIPEEDDVDR
jgi:multisubunit Na+/H+ antiporter MnhE subunit